MVPGSADLKPAVAASPPPRMDWLDYGRMIAALLVMLGHYSFVALDPRINAQITSYGLLTQVTSNGMVAVYFFFIASAMVVFSLAQRETARAFAARRIARVYPIYLLAMILTTIFSQFGPPDRAVEPARFLAGLLMSGPLLGQKYVETVHWTLVVEIQFYVVLLMLKLTGMLRHPQRVVVIGTGVLVLGFALRTNLSLLESSFHCFAAGAVLSLIYQGRNLRLNLALLAILAAMCLVDAYRYAVQISIAPFPFVAITAALFPLFLMLRGCTVRLPHAQRIGSLTYPMYLLHFTIGLVLIHRFGTEANKYFLLAAITLGMIVASAIIDDVMELRLRKFWTRLADRALGHAMHGLRAIGGKLRIASAPR